MDCFAKGCKNRPVIELRYCGEPLCSKHFLKKTWKRIKRHTSQEKLVESGDRIGIGYSGGKDSTVLLHVMHELFSRRKDIALVAITVDEGIAGYRAHSLGLAKRTCRKLGIRHVVISARKEFGKTLDAVAAKLPDSGLTPCSYCGVIRRYLLNRAAQREGCTKVATGHNLDDEAESVIMDFVRGDVQKMVRLGARVGVSRFKGFVQRVKLLRTLPEREVAVFAMLNNWEFDSEICPYARFALRETVRNAMNSIEEAHPGTKYSIVSTADRILPALRKGFFIRAEPRICRNCGELSSRETLCRFCEYMGEGKPSVKRSLNLSKAKSSKAGLENKWSDRGAQTRGSESRNME